MRWTLLCLALLTACQAKPGAQDKTAPPPAQGGPAVNQKTLDDLKKVRPEDYKQYLRDVREFVSALNLFNYPDPTKWEEAFTRLNEFHRKDPRFQVTDGIPNPKQIDEHSDLQLIAMAQGRDAKKAEEARRELGLRAKIIILCWRFEEPYTLVDWKTAKEALVAIGPRGKSMLAFTLLTVIISQRPTDWQHARFYMAELGETGFAIVRGYMDSVMLKSVPEGAVENSPRFMFQCEKLEQCLLTLLQMGPVARDYFLDLSRSPKGWVRRSIAVALVEGKDATYFDILKKYATSDSDEDVRATTFLMLGKAAYAREDAGLILLNAIAVEKSATSLEQITKSLVDLNFRAGVPKLIELLDHPDYPTVRHVMNALNELTGAKKKGVRIQTPADWKRYWNEKLKDTWKE